MMVEMMVDRWSGVEEDKIIVKKQEFENMAQAIEQLEKQVQELEKDDSQIEGGKKVIMRDDEMFINEEHYNSMKSQCLDLEKEVRELKGGEGMVVKEDKNIKVLEGEIEDVCKNLALLAEGKELDVKTIMAMTPWKRRVSRGINHSAKAFQKWCHKRWPT